MTRHILTALGLAAVVAGSVATATGTAATARSDRYTTMYIAEDGFVNYDHTERTWSRTKVDWAAALLFYNNASINKVKNSGLGPYYDQTGSSMDAVLSENRANGYIWDSDGGRKTTKCPGAPGNPDSAYHYRIYADGDDRLYNPSWGYWVWGTTHRDIFECGGGTKRFGYSEAAEDHLVSQWRSRVNTSTYSDWSSWSNQEPYRVEGDHVWDNNGLASALWMP